MAEKAKVTEDLQVKLEHLERERNIFTKQFTMKENNYLEKIKSIEMRLMNNDKFDINLLYKQNKDLENQILHLKNIIEGMNNKHNTEKQKFNNTVTDVILLKEKLLDAIRDLEKLKKEVVSHNNSNNLDKPKLELIIKSDKNNNSPKRKINRFNSIAPNKEINNNSPNLNDNSINSIKSVDRKKLISQSQSDGSISPSPKPTPRKNLEINNLKNESNANENKSISKLLNYDKEENNISNNSIENSPNSNSNIKSKLKPKIPSILNKRIIKNKQEINSDNDSSKASKSDLPDFGVNIKIKSNSQPELNEINDSFKFRF